MAEQQKCIICQEEVNEKAMVKFETCDCKVACTVCVEAYLKYKTKNYLIQPSDHQQPTQALDMVKLMEIPCLNPYCKKPVSAKDLKKLLPKKQYKKYVKEKLISVFLFELFKFECVRKFFNW